jgi:succinate dehydrogenase / fumarate reductase iron-sulfur subunit
MAAKESAKIPSKPAAKKPAAKVALQPAKPAAPKKMATFRILRGTTVGDHLVQKTQDFQVPYDASTTVLQGLEWVKGELDGTLTFRRSCRASICGSCGMYIANRSRLACKTKVHDLVDGNPEKNIAPVKGSVIEIGPQKNQPVLKDLVVDIQPFYSKVKGIHPFVQDGKEKEAHVNKDSFSQVNMVSNCIMCGACYSDCTAMVENPNFIGPAALAKAYRFVADPREGHKTDRLKELSEKDGIWDCTRCGMCIDACPKGVAPMEAIMKLRSLAIEAKITNNGGARHAMAFKGDIATWGVLNEPFMMLKTLGLGVVGQVGNALNLAKKGKIPNPFPFDHKVEGLHEIKAIYKELKENPIDVKTKAADSGPGAG